VKHSEQLDKLAPAMAAAQAKLKPALKEKANPAFKGSKYADLGSVWEACEQALESNGLSVVQGYSTEGPKGSLWTMLLHTSGQYVMGTCPLVLPKDDPQGMGSATTYYRRYGLAAMLGIVQEDDDGNAASRDLPKPHAAKAGDDKVALDWLAKFEECATIPELAAEWAKMPKPLQQNAVLVNAKNARKDTLAKGAA
jgi:hypothetical protein